MNKYNETAGKFCFSQWFETPFTVNNRVYKTSEHWMMAHKALLFGDKDNFEKIITCDTPKEAKEFGRQVLGYDEQIWNENKFDIVKLGNIHKFNQHPDFAQYLLKTGDKILVEASPIDTVWGIGLSIDSNYIDNIYAWRGENLLGFVLMETRDFLKDFGHFKPLENSTQPPWLRFPDVSCNDMFWRMGVGESYLTEFSKYFLLLNERDKKIYELT
ncbi:MAG: NADAR family protein, partial [Bacteroidota bacterium]